MEEVMELTEEEVVKPTEKKQKKTNKVISFKDVDTSHPIYYKSKSDLIRDNIRSLVYPIYKKSEMYYFVVNNGDVKVCAIK